MDQDITTFFPILPSTQDQDPDQEQDQDELEQEELLDVKIRTLEEIYKGWIQRKQNNNLGQKTEIERLNDNYIMLMVTEEQIKLMIEEGRGYEEYYDILWNRENGRIEQEISNRIGENRKRKLEESEEETFLRKKNRRILNQRNERNRTYEEERRRIESEEWKGYKILENKTDRGWWMIGINEEKEIIVQTIDITLKEIHTTKDYGTYKKIELIEPIILLEQIDSEDRILMKEYIDFSNMVEEIYPR